MKGKLFAVSGPSGVGKNTVLNSVVQQRERVQYSISATSRPMRPGEVDGKSYYFVSRARWECSQAVNYDYIVVNDDLTRASEELRAIMLAEKCKTMERIHLIKEELSCSTPQ